GSTVCESSCCTGSMALGSMTRSAANGACNGRRNSTRCAGDCTTTRHKRSTRRVGKGALLRAVPRRRPFDARRAHVFSRQDRVGKAATHDFYLVRHRDRRLCPPYGGGAYLTSCTCRMYWVRKAPRCAPSVPAAPAARGNR